MKVEKYGNVYHVEPQSNMEEDLLINFIFNYLDVIHIMAPDMDNEWERVAVEEEDGVLR